VREHAPQSRAAADYAAVVTALEALWT